MAAFTLKPSAPFRLDLTVWVLRRVAANDMDRWDGATYRRVLVLDGAPVAVEVTQTAPAHAPALSVRTGGARLSARRRQQLVDAFERILGLHLALAPVYRMAANDSRLHGLIAPFLGFKPPRLPSVFEALVNGIACQQVSLAAGLHLLNRLCRTYGAAVGEHHAFPGPADLAGLTPQMLRALGFSIRKATTVLDIARAVREGRLDLAGLSSLDDAAALERLLGLKGIGRWTAQYVLLRGLGRLDVFPGDDVGGQNKMQRWLGRKSRPGYEQMYRILAPWRPYRGLIYFYLLLDHQARLGLLESSVSGSGQGAPSAG